MIKKFNFRTFLNAAAISSSLFLGVKSVNSAPIKEFVSLNRYAVEGAVAEIISATPDGNTLVYTNAGDGKVGLLDIRDPQNPQLLGNIDVSDLGEPTAVAVTPNSRYALVTVLNLAEEIADQQPGILVFIDLAQQEIVARVPLIGIGPDNLSVTPDGRKAIIAIEDEEDEDSLPGQRPGSVNFVTIDYNNPANSTVNNVELDLSEVEGVNYAEDPQPEYVAISKNGRTVAISLQENNAIAVLDIAEEKVTSIFSAGTSLHDRADIVEDGDIDFSQPLEGRREPDSIAMTADGRYIITANEGDTSLDSFGDGIWSGGRGWSILDLQGNVVYDSGDRVEELAILRGQYPEGRSENRGIEMEGAAVAQFGDREYAFMASERGSFLVIYDITNVRDPELVSFLPTGKAPEGVLPLPQRNLVLTANEDDGTIDFFAAKMLWEPILMSPRVDLPFSALSGLVPVPNNPGQIYAVPDNAMQPSRIFRMAIGREGAMVNDATIITKEGEPANYDLEGIAIAPRGGFWLVSEGDNSEGQEKPNILIKVNSRGEVEEEVFLPEEAATRITRFGFEGVTTSSDGRKVYVAMQRELAGEDKVRIGEYDVEAKAWDFFYYPLDTDNVGGWVGLSEISRDIDGSFLVIERDNQGGENGASNVRIKRIYRFSLNGVEEGETVEKELVADLFTDSKWYEEKVEGLAVTEAGYWVISDNDGGESSTRLLFLPR
ncbi:esterase-like activity of phytase family protein [Spirulina sp. 06S082]|uniref:esterase-like activity of phytase family protein n=1 Tax=Spirulina sp. 06S082 TaxID=3110248 RepID=UPI002B1FA0CB|nr:esterase-like activity of phytase family protein [Spirulina sp. 06S082]MEA5468977.1 esterase-like activity of phytase family protein [Spirulina sp. 06S082]